MTAILKLTPKMILTEDTRIDYNKWKKEVHVCSCGVELESQHESRNNHFGQTTHQHWLKENNYDLKATVFDHYLMTKGRYFENQALGLRKLQAPREWKPTPRTLLYDEIKHHYNDWKVLVENCPCGALTTKRNFTKNG